MAATATQNRETATDRPPKNPVLRWSYVLPLLGLITAVGLFGFGWGGSLDRPERVAEAGLSRTDAELSVIPVLHTVSPETGAVAGESTDERRRRLIVGQWETERSGRRVLTAREDGTAVMTVEVQGAWALMLGREITLHLQWQIVDGRLIFETTGGAPEASISVLRKLYGDKRDVPILELSEMTLRVPDDEPEDPDHIWTRISPVVQ